MKRRELLGALGTLPLGAGACSRQEQKPPAARGAPEQSSAASTGAMPVVFAAHGAPVLLDDAQWMAELSSWAGAMPRPKSILMVSAHWEERPTTLGATSSVPLVYDFYGFPERFYQTRYPAPGAPELAARIRARLRQRNIAFKDDPKRGLDHGAYVPLVAMYPQADIPVLQLSMPALNGHDLLALGQALAPLRHEGVLIFGSGFLTHNMRYGLKTGTPTWASEFDAWVAEALSRLDVDALLDFEARAPGARIALPTWEHYAPVLVATGAALSERPKVRFPITGWWNDSAFTKRSVELG
jgi:4,5-DOPA dioxygenase extradiol